MTQTKPKLTLIEEGLVDQAVETALDTVAGVQVLEQAAQTKRYSLGRPWDETACLANIQRAGAVLLEAVVEIGRNLLWAKASLPHGQFLPWVATHTSFSRASAANYMAIAEVFLDRPQLLAELRGIGVKKALLLTQLDPELVEQIGNPAVPELDPKALADSSYGALKEQLKTLQKSHAQACDDLGDQIERADKAEKQLDAVLEREHKNLDEINKLNQRLNELAGLRPMDNDEVIEKVNKAFKALDEAFVFYQLKMDGLSRRWPELSPAAQAHLRGVVEAVHTRAQALRLRHIELQGEEVLGWEWSELLTKAKATDPVFPLPEMARPQAWDADAE